MSHNSIFFNPIKNVQRLWIDISPKKIHRWPTGTWKDAQHHWSSGKCKWKPQWDHFTLVRMVMIKKTRNNNWWQRCEERGTFVHCWWEYKLPQLLQKTVWKFLKFLKLNYHIIQQFHFWVFTQRKQKHYGSSDMSMQPICPLIDGWI